MDAKCEVCGVVAEIADESLVSGRVEFQCVGCNTPHWATRGASGRLPRKSVPVKRARASRPPVDDAPVPDSTRLDDLRSLAQRSAVSASSLPPPRFGAPPALLAVDPPRSAVAPEPAPEDFDEVAPPSVREAIRSSAPPLSDPDAGPQSDASAQSFARDVDGSGAPSSRRFGAARSARAGVAAVACAAMLFGTGSALSARLGPDRGVAVTGAAASVSAAAHGATYGSFDVDVVTSAARPVAERVSAQAARTAASTEDGSAAVMAAARSARTAPAGAGGAVRAAAAPPAGQATAAAPAIATLNRQAAPPRKQRVAQSADAGPKTLAEAMAQATRTSKK
ncbi:MAG: hypothetical protein WKG00_36235 [Polyangiaceae bacterium]